MNPTEGGTQEHRSLRRSMNAIFSVPGGRIRVVFFGQDVGYICACRRMLKTRVEAILHAEFAF